MTSIHAKALLIVEDESIVAHDIQQTLVAQGYDPFAIASTGEEAVAYASQRCPDLVLMDIRIKGRIDGVTTAGLLRKRFDVPIVYLTAHADEATVARARKTEPYGYLMKPVKSAELRSAVEIGLYKHQMDKRLRERERWFSTTLESIADAVITVDLGGNVTFMNPAAEELTGSTLERACGHPAREILSLVAPTHSASPLDDALARRETVVVPEATLESASRPSRIVADSAAPVFDDGNVLGAVMVIRDITEHKSLQKQLELADRLASLGTMAAGVAHEVNNPLAVVAANSALVADEMTRLLSEVRGNNVAAEDVARRLEEALELQSSIQSAAGRIGQVVSDLKAFSRPTPQTAGQADVARAIEWAIRSTSAEFHSRAQVSTEVTDVRPVAMDEIRLGQILVNLLINSAHAIAPGNMGAHQVSVIARSTPDDRVAIEVRDSGCGMTPEILARIFEPFFTTKAVGEGTGLGLSICHGIVKSVGGDLQVESQLGQGTVFRFSLPVAPEEKSEAAADVSVVAPVAARAGRILVIDDDDMVRKAIQLSLKKHEPVCLSNAKEALALLDSGQRFDIIFCDLMMPEMTGMDFYEELLKKYPDDARRVIFLSGGAVTGKVADFLASVPNLQMDKPFDIAGLRSAVQRLLAARAPC